MKQLIHSEKRGEFKSDGYSIAPAAGTSWYWVFSHSWDANGYYSHIAGLAKSKQGALDMAFDCGAIQVQIAN